MVRDPARRKSGSCVASQDKSCFHKGFEGPSSGGLSFSQIEGGRHGYPKE